MEHPMEPLLCAPLLRTVDQLLLDLLRALEPREWDLPAGPPQWAVRDVAAHLLDTSLRKLALVRDGWMVAEAAPQAAEDLVALVNRLNREGVTVYRRLSPALLCGLMERACQESADFHESLDPFAPAAWAVSWAGESHSLNWFDTAREYTERWHHQQQIREATGRPGLLTPTLYTPVLDCFARGLPHAHRNVEAEAGARVVLEVTGECGGSWALRREAAAWVLEPGAGRAFAAKAFVPQEIAWRIFTKGISREAALAVCRLEGQSQLVLPVFEMTAIAG